MPQLLLKMLDLGVHFNSMLCPTCWTGVFNSGHSQPEATRMMSKTNNAENVKLYDKQDNKELKSAGLC